MSCRSSNKTCSVKLQNFPAPKPNHVLPAGLINISEDASATNANETEAGKTRVADLEQAAVLAAVANAMQLRDTRILLGLEEFRDASCANERLNLLRDNSS